MYNNILLLSTLTPLGLGLPEQAIGWLSGLVVKDKPTE
jgi:hypothetical protein